MKRELSLLKKLVCCMACGNVDLATSTTWSQWLHSSWSMHPHALHAVCVCFRCVWRRVHSRFWESLPAILQCNSAIMNSAEDSQILLGGEPIPGTLPSQQPLGPAAVPDSYVDLSRVRLPPPPNASIPTGTRAVFDRLKPMFEATFPNLHRVFNAKSRPEASISWEFCSAEEMWSIMTCKFLAAGAQQTMSWYLHEALKFTHQLLSRFVSVASNADTTAKVRAPPAAPLSFIEHLY